MALRVNYYCQLRLLVAQYVVAHVDFAIPLGCT